MADANSKILTATEKVFGLDPKLKNSVAIAAKEKKVITSDVYKCSVHHELHINFVAPVIKDQKVIAVIVFQFNPAQKFYPLLSTSPTESYSTESYIGKKENDSVVVLSELKFKKDAVLKHKYSIKDTNSAIVKAVNGFTGLTQSIDYRGEEVIAYVNHIAGTNWYMVTKIDKKELFQDLTRESILLITFLIIIIALIFSSIAFIYSIRQRNTYKQLYYSQKEYLVTLNSIGDAVISTDTEGKIKFINQVAEQLTGWNHKDAIGKPLEDVFRIINEQTRNKVENPVEKVLREGTVVGLANHTLLISKDGKEIPIADSGAPIKNDEGEILGVVLVFRDQTKEREANRKIKESEANLLSMVNNKDQAIWSLDENYNLIICNDYFKNSYKAAYKYELKVGINLVEILPQELKAFWKPKYDKALSGEKVDFEFSETILGKKYYFQVFLNPIFIDGKIKGVSALSVDITELKEAEEKLESSEINYRTIFNSTSEAVFIDDASTGQMIDINDTVLKMYGYDSKEEVLALNIGELSANIGEYNNEHAQELIRKTIEEGPQRFEWLAKRKDGSTFWIEMYLKKTYILGQERILAVGREIDEQKKAKEKILNQLAELQRWQNVMLNREDRVIELKKEVNELLQKLGKQKKYEIT